MNQNKLAVSLIQTVENGQILWNAILYCPEKKDAFSDVFYSGQSFGIAHYYADYLQYLIGVKTDEKPESWDYDEKALTPPENFDFSLYDTVAENQPVISISRYALPESNGNQNWTVTIQSDKYEWFELSSYQSEFYDQARMYEDNMNFILGMKEEEPNAKDYDLKMKKNASTGEIFY